MSDDFLLPADPPKQPNSGGGDFVDGDKRGPVNPITGAPYFNPTAEDIVRQEAPDANATSINDFSGKFRPSTLPQNADQAMQQRLLWKQRKAAQERRDDAQRDKDRRQAKIDARAQARDEKKQSAAQAKDTAKAAAQEAANQAANDTNASAA